MWKHAPYYAKEAICWLAVRSVGRLSRTVVEAILAICGIWCLLTPLLLWVAWNGPVFFFILGSAAMACCILCFLAVGASEQEEAEDGSTALPPSAATPPANTSARRGSLPTWRDHA